MIPLEQKWQCTKCNQVAEGKKELRLEVTPELLILHLKRFKNVAGYWTKDSRNIDIPGTINLFDLEFSLVAVVEHSGSFDSGHYTAFVKMNNQWFSCNDNEVEEVSCSKFVGGSAYLVFYRQK